MDHPDLRRTLLALAWMAAGVGSLVGVYALAVRTAAGQTLDTAVMVRLGAWTQGTALAEAAEDLLDLVSPLSVLLATAAVGLLALAVRGRRAAAAAVATVVGTTVLAQVLKEVLARPALEPAGAVAANSLPSGHTAAVAGLAAGLVIGLRLHASAAAWSVAAVLTGGFGLATVALQWHRPSDVVAAGILAVLVGAAAWWAGGTGRAVRHVEPHVTAA